MVCAPKVDKILPVFLIARQLLFMILEFKYIL